MNICICIASIVVIFWVLYDWLFVEKKKNNEIMRRMDETRKRLKEKYDRDIYWKL